MPKRNIISMTADVGILKQDGTMGTGGGRGTGKQASRDPLLILKFCPELA